MSDADHAWVRVADGVMLTVRLTPKGGRDAVDGLDRLSDGRAVVKMRVRAAPSEGAANAALIRLVAQALEVAPRQVSLAGGAGTRVKRLKIEGDAARLAAALYKLVG